MLPAEACAAAVRHANSSGSGGGCGGGYGRRGRVALLARSRLPRPSAGKRKTLTTAPLPLPARPRRSRPRRVSPPARPPAPAPLFLALVRAAAREPPPPLDASRTGAVPAATLAGKAARCSESQAREKDPAPRFLFPAPALPRAQDQWTTPDERPPAVTPRPCCCSSTFPLRFLPSMRTIFRSLTRPESPLLAFS